MTTDAWPARMQLATAARYLDICPDSFLKLVRLGQMPRPRRDLALRLNLWQREDIDRYRGVAADAPQATTDSDRTARAESWATRRRRSA